MSKPFLSQIKPVFKCPPEWKDRFKQSTCLLTVSVGQEVHEGEKFSSTIDLINNAFEKIIILVDDCLQRHSMSLLSTAGGDALYQASIEDGDRWLERNLKFYSRLSVPYTILRWEAWLNHPRYAATYAQISDQYLHNPQFTSTFNSTAQIFLDRFIKRAPLNATKTYEDAFAICLEYLKEECSALCLWVEGGYHFEVYPNKRNSAMQITHETLVCPQFPDLLHPVSIKFKNRKQLKPQAFNALCENMNVG